MVRAATARARSLRRTETEAEHKLWLKLRHRRLAGHKFVRQMPVGPFFADFACRDAKLIVELDGGQHADSAHDASRDRFPTSFAVLRFWTSEVFAMLDTVCETILAAIEDRLDPFDRYRVPSSVLSGTFSPVGRRAGTDLPEPCPSPRRGEGPRSGDEGTTSPPHLREVTP